MSEAWKEFADKNGRCSLCSEGVVWLTGKALLVNGNWANFGFCICPPGRARKKATAEEWKRHCERGGHPD